MQAPALACKQLLLWTRHVDTSFSESVLKTAAASVLFPLHVQTQISGGLFLRMLVEVERRASAGAGAAATLLADRAALGAVLDGLKRPSAGAAYTAWAASAELAQAARVAARLMRHGDSGREPLLLLQRACIAAAQVSAQYTGWNLPQCRPCPNVLF